MYESSAWIDGQMLFCCSKYYWEQDTHATVGDDFQQSDSHFAASYMIRVKRNRFLHEENDFNGSVHIRSCFFFKDNNKIGANIL